MDFLTDDSIMNGGSPWTMTKHLTIAFILGALSVALVILYERLSEDRLPQSLKDIRNKNKSESLWWKWGGLIGSVAIIIIVWIGGFNPRNNFGVPSMIVMGTLGIQTGLCLSLANPEDAINLQGKL